MTTRNAPHDPTRKPATTELRQLDAAEPDEDVELFREVR